MGGNIEFFSKTRRFDREEFFLLQCEVLDLLYEDGVRCEPITAYATKESFGDMDIVVDRGFLTSSWVEEMVNLFQLRVGDWVVNSNVMSFSYKGIQIDLITMPPEDFRSSLDYFAYNDLGNLVGRIAHKFGIKYGHRGAHLVLREGTYEFGEILLTKDTEKIYKLLDLDYDKYFNNGIKTKEDIFQLVSSSKYFNPEIFLLDNRNHTSKIRDRKRQTYHDFLVWCSEREFPNAYPYEDLTERGRYNIREPFFTDLIIPAFPHVKDMYDKCIAKHNEAKAFKEKFNGELVMSVTGIQGKELGEFVSWARDTIEREDAKNCL